MLRYFWSMIAYLLSAMTTNSTTDIGLDPEEVEERVASLSALDPILEELYSVSSYLNPSNTMVAGGCIRDLLCGRKPKDIDVYVNVGRLHKNQFARLMGMTTYKRTYQLREDFLDRYCPTHLSKVADSSALSAATKYTDEAILVLTELEDLTEDTDREQEFWSGHWDRYGKKTTEQLGGFCFGTKVQVIVCSYANQLEDVLDGFDLDICMLGYNPERGLIRGEKSPPLEEFYAKMQGSLPVELGITHDIAVTDERIDRFRERYGCDMKKASKALMKLDGVPNGKASVFMGYPNTLTKVY